MTVSSIDDFEFLPQPVEDVSSTPKKVRPKSKQFINYPESQGKTVAEAEKALNHYNEIHAESKIIAQKGDVGLYTVDYITGAESPVSAINLRTILTQEGFFWHNPAKSEDDAPRAKQPDPAVFKSLVTLPPCDKPSVPVYTSLHYGALMHLDGTIRSEHGLDESTQIICVNDIDVPDVPEHPTEGDVIIAKERIYSLLHEFLFKVEDGETVEQSTAYQNAVFFLFACVLRPSIRGAFPLFIINKNLPRLGGSLLTDTISMMAFGHKYGQLTFSKNVEENEKAFKAKLTENLLFCDIDNVETPVNRGEEGDWVFPTLLTATTGGQSARVDFRKLGTNEVIHVEPRGVFCANGINIKLSADITGRVIVIDLASNTPWQELSSQERSNNNLLKTAEEAHPTIIASIATMFRYWKDMGCPPARQIKGNISEYRDLVDIAGGIMTACGYDRYLDNVAEVQTTRNDKDYIGKIVLEQLYEEFQSNSFTLKDLKLYLKDEVYPPEDTPTPFGCLDVTVAETILKSDEIASIDKMSTSKLGLILKKYYGPFAGCNLTITAKRTNKGTIYQIVDRSQKVCESHMGEVSQQCLET